MSLFCLVHGSTQEARCWNLLVPELQKRGHKTILPRLPTEDAKAGINLYAKAIQSSISAQNRDVIIVGHSAGGYFVALVAAERPARRVVFLASIIPELGASFLDQLARNSGIFCPSWIGKDPSKDDAAAMDFLFHDCAPEVARGAMTTRILLPLKQRYPLDQWPATKYSDIACSEDRTINPAWSRRVAHERLGIDPRDFGRPLPVSVEARRTRGNLIAKRLS